MKIKQNRKVLIWSIILALGGFLFGFDTAVISGLASEGEVSTRLPNDVMPVIGAWFWGEDEFNPDGYKSFIDDAKTHSPYNLLTTSLRVADKEITDTAVHNQLKLAVEYAKNCGIQMAVDLDVRLARRAFEAEYPEELQKMLMLKEVVLSESESVEAVIHSLDLGDHMTSRTIHYIPLQGSLLRVYSYQMKKDGIDPNTLKEITTECTVVSESKDSVVVSIPAKRQNSQTRACAMVAFTHLTPAVFAPHLIEFQREIVRSYADIPMAGGMKDEWGFPPTKLPMDNKYWYSKYIEKAYAERTGGRELLADCLLMYLGIEGQENDRQMAINHLIEMNWQRNGELEDDFYQTVKDVFGPNAAVVTHPTWYAYFCEKEYRKNGLDWWAATRDWAQTDENAPFAVRTSLAKKWNSPVWYNQYYASEIESYQKELWSSALAGGRLNYHPIYPNYTDSDGHVELLRGKLMQGESKVRLLNYIAQSPLNCPVAIVFGHQNLLNWAGPNYNDAGLMELVNEFWCNGIPADLIPSSEIEGKSLFIDKDGWISYGAQNYSAIILYNPEFEKESTADFFNKASKGKTRMFRFGNWTKDFNGQVFNGNASLPKNMDALVNYTAMLEELYEILKGQGIGTQSPATKIENRKTPPFITHPTSGMSRFIDGTILQVAGTNNVEGDPIYSTIKVKGYDVFFDAIGVAAIRLNDDGQVQAMVAGGLKSFKTGTFEINLEDRMDIALWINEKEELEGVIQGWKGEIPIQLLAITKNWGRLNIPLPL